VLGAMGDAMLDGTDDELDNSTRGAINSLEIAL
jgi:hypothetical protein